VNENTHTLERGMGVWEIDKSGQILGRGEKVGGSGQRCTSQGREKVGKVVEGVNVGEYGNREW